MACEAVSHRFESPTTKLTNRLLWGNADEGNVGLLVRAPDRFDRDFLKKFRQKTHYLPASFLHASLRASNGVFSLHQGSFGRSFDVALIVGSRYKKNWSMERLQEDGSVDTPVFYPVDSDSTRRRSLLNTDGTGCVGGQDFICYNGKCLISKESQCACNTDDIPPDLFGDHFARWLAGRKREVDRMSTVSCWFPGTYEGMSQMIIASNSFWTERRRRSDTPDTFYRGWTEVPATKNIVDVDMIDAIAVTLPVSTSNNVSLCHFSPQEQALIQRSIHIMGSGRSGKRFKSPMYRSLPVIFYTESQGMDDSDECDRLWNGKDCVDGYRKEFFAQEFNFSNGACLSSPPGCEDVYYFPRDDATGLCFAFSHNRSKWRCDRERRVNAALAPKSGKMPGMSADPRLSLEQLAITTVAEDRFDLHLGELHGIRIHQFLSSMFVSFSLLGFAFGALKKNGIVRRNMEDTRLFLCSFSSLRLIRQLLQRGKWPSTQLCLLGLAGLYAFSATLIWISGVAGTSVARNSYLMIPMNSQPACANTVPNDTRILLLTIVPALHGSTALMSVLMSSPDIATYCAGKTWQCEGYVKVKKIVCPGKSTCLRDVRQLPPNGKQMDILQEHRNINLLNIFSNDWNLSKPILMDKQFPREPGYTRLWDLSLESSTLPMQMTELGIRTVQPAYVIMWTPLCVMSLQKTSSDMLDNSTSTARDFLQKEIWNLETMKERHQSLLKEGTPVLMLSYADLLFREDFAVSRISSFLPCSGGVTTNFVPKMGVDIFWRNRWKVRGTVHNFSSGLNPDQCCGYDINENRCANRTYFKLIPEYEERLTELESYFIEHSSPTSIFLEA